MPEIALETGGYNRLIKGKYGYVLFNKNDTYVGKAFEAYGEFSENEVALFRQVCRPGDHVIDVGANIGAHTLAFSRMVGQGGRVYAFEPQRIVFQTLCANMAINSIENVETFQMAVGAESGSTLIPEIRYDLPANHGGFRVQAYASGVKTPVVTLDTMLDLPRLRFFKIDVEGMETDVVEGAKETIDRHKPFLYVENDKADKSKALIERIADLDYRLFWHMPPLFNPQNFAGNPVNIYERLVSVNMLCIHRSLNLEMDGFVEIIDSGFHPVHNPK